LNGLREPDSFEFADYLGVLRRQWWLVVILTCVGILAGVGYLTVAQKAYTATAAVNVTPTGVSQSQSGAVANGRTTTTINLDTEAQLVKSTAVATIAAHNLHTPLAPSVLVREVSVTVPPNSSVLQVGCTSRSAQGAADCANAFASAYLQNRNTSAASTIETQLNAVRAQQNTLEKQAAQLTTQVSTLPTNSSQRGSAQTQLQTINGELTNLANQAASLTAAAAYSGGTVITSATPPTKPSSPKLLLILPSAILAGLLIGLILAFAADRWAKRIGSVRELNRFGVPVLLSLAAKHLRTGAMVAPRSAAGLEFAELARVTATELGQDNQLLLVAGASPGTSCGVVAANLAATLARTRDRVILVCQGDQHTLELLGITDAPQLDSATAAGLAAGTVSLAEAAVRPAGFPGLAVLILDSDLSELHYELARELAQQLRGSARYVLIEAPASATGADNFALAEFCNAALVAVEIARTKRPELEDRINLLDRLGIRILGLAAVPQLKLAGHRSVVGMAAKVSRSHDPLHPTAAAAAPDAAGSAEISQRPVRSLENGQRAAAAANVEADQAAASTPENGQRPTTRTPKTGQRSTRTRKTGQRPTRTAKTGQRPTRTPDAGQRPTRTPDAGQRPTRTPDAGQPPPDLTAREDVGQDVGQDVGEDVGEPTLVFSEIHAENADELHGN
jgi:capsular polysaccharide biosynthesis protein